MREVKRWSAFGGGSGLRIVTEEDMRRRYERFMKEQEGDEPNADEPDHEDLSAEDEAA